MIRPSIRVATKNRQYILRGDFQLKPDDYDRKREDDQWRSL